MSTITNLKTLPLHIVSLVLLFGLSGCGEKTGVQATGAVGTNSSSKPEVTTVSVTRQNYEREIPLTGTLRPKARAGLRSLSSGPIESVSVDIGDSVRKDQKLAQIRSVDAELAVDIADSVFGVAKAEWIGLKAWRRDEDMAILRAKVSEAEATYKQRELDYKRSRDLYKSAASSESKRDSAKAAMDVAKASLAITTQQLNIAETGPSLANSNLVEAKMAQTEALLIQARQGLTDTTIRAPFDGVITGTYKKMGDYVRTGDELLELTDVSVLEAEFLVPERYSQVVVPGLEISLKIGGSGLERTGTISTVNAVVDEKTRTFLVKVNVDNSDRKIKGGTFCNGILSLPTLESVLSIPHECLHEDEGNFFVWKVENNIASRLQVTVGERDDRFTAILGEFNDTAQVVISGHGALTEGVEVIVEEGK